MGPGQVQGGSRAGPGWVQGGSRGGSIVDEVQMKRTEVHSEWVFRRILGGSEDARTNPPGVNTEVAFDESRTEDLWIKKTSRPGPWQI